MVRYRVSVVRTLRSILHVSDAQIKVIDRTYSSIS